MSRAELLQQTNLSGQIFPFIQHVTVYPNDVIGCPLQYQAWTDFLHWALTHEQVGDLIDALDLPDLGVPENDYPRICGLICDYSTRAMWAKEHDLVYLEAH